MHLVSVVHGLYVSLQDLTELTEDDLQNLGKMTGLKMRKRRQLINAVKELLGHSSLNATQHYTHVSTGRLKDAHRGSPLDSRGIF